MITMQNLNLKFNFYTCVMNPTVIVCILSVSDSVYIRFTLLLLVSSLLFWYLHLLLFANARTEQLQSRKSQFQQQHNLRLEGTQLILGPNPKSIYCIHCCSDLWVGLYLSKRKIVSSRCQRFGVENILPSFTHQS